MESKPEHNVTKADIDDIDELIDIFSHCFPYSFKWHAPRFLLREKWLSHLQSGSVEVYMIKINNEIACFDELVVDVPSFGDIIKKENRLYQFLSYLYVAVAHPKCIIPAIKKLIKEIKYVNSNKPINTTKSNIDIKKIAWEEWSGVYSKYRGIGLSKIMQKHILNRCLELGKDTIKCIIAPENIPSMNLHKSFDYIITSEQKHGYVLTKYLNIMIAPKPSSDNL